MSATGLASAIRLTRVSAFAASLLFVSFLVVGTSRSAFSDTTDTSSSNISAASVSLVDDDSGTSMFSVSGMIPNQTIQECIRVTYNGDLTPAAAVQMYRAGAITGTGLDQYLDLVIELGSGGNFGDCTGFSATSTIFTGNTLQNFATTHTNYAGALSTGWTPTGAGQFRTFRISMTLQNNNAAQGLTATFGFTWEVQS